MALPKKRHSTQRQGKRRAAIKIKLHSLGECSNCHQPVRSHIVCKNCGYYKGRDILNYEEKKRSKTSKAGKSR